MAATRVYLRYWKATPVIPAPIRFECPLSVGYS